MYVWDYVVNFSNYIILHPNFRVLQKNLQIMRDNNVIGVFEQGDTYNDNACFGNYKKYIIAKLIWNPDIDFDKETKAFLHAYYGPAEKEMYDFINHVNKVIEKTDFKLSIFPYNNAYFNAEDWIYCFKCFNRALKNTENTKYYDRVKFDMLCFQTGFLLCPKKDVLKVYDEVELMYSDPKKFLDYIDNYLPEHDVENYRETENWQKGFFHILDLENKKEGKIPEICNNINNSDWADFQSDKFTDWGDPERQKIVDDETSSNGKARWLNTKYDEWYVTQNLYGMYLDKNIKGGEVYVTYKIINPKEGSCFKVGIYDPHGTWIYNEKYKITEKEFNADPKMKDQWITEKVGDVDFMNCNFDTYIYAACNKNENSADGVLIDRFFVIYDKIK